MRGLRRKAKLFSALVVSKESVLIPSGFITLKNKSNNQLDAMAATFALRFTQIILSWEPGLVT